MRWEIIEFVSFGEEADKSQEEKTCDEFGDALEDTVILEIPLTPIGSDTAEWVFFRECGHNKRKSFCGTSAQEVALCTSHTIFKQSFRVASRNRPSELVANMGGTFTSTSSNKMWKS
jgi:hypothetical protein